MNRRNFLKAIAALPIVAAFPKFAQQVTRLADMPNAGPFSLSGWYKTPRAGISHVRVWDKFLTSEELLEEMFSPMPVNQKNLVYSAYMSSEPENVAALYLTPEKPPFSDFGEFTTMQLPDKDIVMEPDGWYYQTLTSDGQTEDYSVYDEDGKLVVRLERRPS